MKKIILVLAVLLLLGGGAAAAWWFFFKPADGAEDVVEAPPEIPSGYLEFAPMVIPLIKEGVVTHHVTVKIIVEVPEGDPLINTERWKIRLRNDFMAELHGLYNYRYFTKEGYATPVIQNRLVIVAQKVMGKDAIRGVELIVEGISKPSNS
ncbi:hypothetical protein [Kiloniella laminariae]|uniref:hypothetical protein n=1 Tax=Kiloniella laminariae TaxID=454162 RepID=UPI00035DD944|nr:hypothetical protein [Kiloniella laminariae]